MGQTTSFVYVYEGRQIFADTRPVSRAAAVIAVRDLFGVARSADICFYTDELPGCNGKMTEIPAGSWERIVPQITRVTARSSPPKNSEKRVPSLSISRHLLDDLELVREEFNETTRGERRTNPPPQYYSGSAERDMKGHGAGDNNDVCAHNVEAVTNRADSSSDSSPWIRTRDPNGKIRWVQVAGPAATDGRDQ
ncbi:hypothetical protein NLJ89_g364 [Agrocybe chaxingu]|uniref:Uncharacterized protein n=1 Tax=Agrocybe chaxingu TaxID=84603 RepID=A0A9W8TF77_9AGAR|nr:hypothetical protein NLJ89_g364 [Agrocybe chaxingu]